MGEFKKTKRITAVAALLAVGGITHSIVRDAMEQPPKPCEAVDFRNKRIAVSAYPTGKIAVGFQEIVEIGSSVTETPGVIENRSGKYILKVPDLPDKDRLTNDRSSFGHTDAVIFLPIAGHEAGIGISAACIQEAPNASEATATVLLPLQP